MFSCEYCAKTVERTPHRYCSNACQSKDRHEQYIKKWKRGEASGTRGKNAKNISGHIRRYLLHKYNNRCSLCGWSQVNPVSGKVPLEVDHADGDAENNEESNLRLLCPNCHSLTPSFRNLNKGGGRAWRRGKYIKS